MARKNVPQKPKSSKTRVRGAAAASTKSIDDLIAKHTGRADAGRLAVLLALASTATGVRVDGSKTPIATNPPNLLERPFNDVAVGITTPAQMTVWKANLRHLLPQFASQIEDIPTRPDLRIGEAARFVSSLMTHGLETAPMGFVLGPVAESRKRVADRFGKSFADKSSKELLQRLSAPAREAFGIIGGGPAAAPPLVLEFSEASPDTPQPTQPTSTDHRASRQIAIAHRRDEFLKKVSPVRMMLEKFAGAGTVQVCWLNATMRAAAQPNVVAEVAGHSDLQTLDIPRRMVREMNVAAVTVNGPAFRLRLNVSGRGIRVAVIDGEVNVNHPALAGRVTLQENFTKEAFGNPDGHGTAVAGIIGAADAMFGGMAPDATIINYKVFRSDDAVGDEFQGILAVQHALQDGADIANCSWGTGPTGDGTSREARAFNTAWTQGLILIKSSGNAGPGAGSMTSPADADGVIVVAATNRQGTDVPDYSSRGPSANGKHPHLAAPGGTQFSGINTCLANVQSGNFGDAGFGTSFAAPMIAGAAALLRQQTPNITPDQVRDRLVGICRAFAGNDPNLYGAGILDLSAFV